MQQQFIQPNFQTPLQNQSPIQQAQDSPNQTYISYEVLQPFDSNVNIVALLEWIKINLEEKALWSNNLAALNALRQLNRFNTQHINEICRLIWPSLVICMSSPRPVISKTSLMFIQELFHHSGNNLYDDIIKSLEPPLVQKVHSEKAFLKQEAQKAYQLMIERCVKDATIVAVCLSCRNKSAQISELSMKALERMISVLGQNILQLQPLTFKEIFLVIINGLDGKRAEMYKSSENLVKMCYQLLGDQNFSQLVNALMSEQIIKNEDLAKLKKVFEEKESKQKEHLSDVLKNQRILKTNEKYSNSALNYGGQNMGIESGKQANMMNNGMGQGQYQQQFGQHQNNNGYQ